MDTQHESRLLVITALAEIVHRLWLFHLLLATSGNDCVVTQRDVVANDSIARTTDARVDDTIISHDSAGAEFDVITYDTAISNHDTIMNVAKLSQWSHFADWAHRTHDGI